MTSFKKSIGKHRRMSLRPPRAFPFDFLNEINRKHKKMSLRPPMAFPIEFLSKADRKSKENEPEASKGISY